jgi:hypothetical protein
MPYRYHSKAYADPSSPQAWAVCDRCGSTYLHKNLQWQYEFNGAGLYNKRLLVCSRCLDVPQPQFLNPILPPDPTPVLNARPPNYPVNFQSPNQQLLAQIFCGSNLDETLLFIDLYLGNPATTGTSQLSSITGSATRTNVASIMTDGPAIYVNTSDIVFTSSSQNSVNISYVAFFSAAMGGTLVAYGPLAQPQTVVKYNGLEFPTGNMVITVAATQELSATVPAPGYTTTPPALFLDIYNGNPSTTGASVLATMTGSATRQDVTGDFIFVPDDQGTSGTGYNDTAISITQSVVESVSFQYLAFFDAATGGNLVAYGLMTGPTTVFQYETITFPIGSIELEYTVSEAMQLLIENGTGFAIVFTDDFFPNVTGFMGSAAIAELSQALRLLEGEPAGLAIVFTDPSQEDTTGFMGSAAIKEVS